MKKFNTKVFAVILIGIFIVGFVGLAFAINFSKEKNQNPIDENPTIILKGITDSDIIVTKTQILALPVVEFTTDRPAYASDKEDLDNKKIPHTVKGAYLDDVLNVYGFSCLNFSSINVIATDTYESLLTNSVYNTANGGSKIIIAYEYDGVVLNSNESSGSFRFVIDNQAMNTWVKKIQTLIFSKIAIVDPTPNTVYFYETLSQNNDYFGSFYNKEGVLESGISLFKLINTYDILSATDNSLLKFYAWDDQKEGVNKAYIGYRGYEYFKSAFLLLSDNAPTLDRQNPPNSDLKGMSVKNIVSIATENTAIMSFQTLFVKFKTVDISLSLALQICGMAIDTDFIITTSSGNTNISNADFANLKIFKTESSYVIKNGDTTYENILSIRGVTK